MKHARSLSALALALTFTAAAGPAHARNWFCENSKGSYDCWGARYGIPALQERLANPKETQSRTDVAKELGLLYATEAAPSLRAALATETDPWAKAAIAAALVRIGDTASENDVVRFCHEVEGKVSSAWETCFDALADAGRGRAYALDIAQRIAPPFTSWGDTLARRVIPVLVREHVTEALPILRRWGAHPDAAKSPRGDGPWGTPPDMRDHLFGAIQGARMRLGDEALAAQVRGPLGTPNAVVPAYPEHWVAGLGSSEGDIPALARFASSTAPESREAYDGIDRLIAVLGKRTDAAARRGEDLLRTRLNALTAHRENREHIQFEARMLARHHASLARLGVAASQKRLLELAVPEENGRITTVIPYVAAEHAVQMKLPGATDAAATILLAARRGMDMRQWESVRALVRAMEDAGDVRYAIGLAVGHPIVREEALAFFARHPTDAACAESAKASVAATEEGSDAALLALTLRPTEACDAALLGIAQRSDASPRTRAVAAEARVLLRGPDEVRWLDAIAETDQTRLVKQTGARMAILFRGRRPRAERSQ